MFQSLGTGQISSSIESVQKERHKACVSGLLDFGERLGLLSQKATLPEIDWPYEQKKLKYMMKNPLLVLRCCLVFGYSILSTCKIF